MHRTRNFALVVICAAALLLSFTLPHAWAQKKPDAKTKSVEKNGRRSLLQRQRAESRPGVRRES